MATTRRAAATAGFRGFPAAALEFFDDLEEHNERSWWQANRSRYDESVRGPLDAFLAEAAPEFGTAHVFRPNRDTRFSTDKTPYKTNIGAVIHDGAAMYYVHLDGGGLFAAAGAYMMASDQIARYRAAVADDRTGSGLAAIVEAAEASGLSVHQPDLQRVPPPYPKDHPRGALLRCKSMTLGRRFGTPAWLHTRRAGAEITRVWRDSKPLVDWLGAHVGPSEQSNERRR